MGPPMAHGQHMGPPIAAPKRVPKSDLPSEGIPERTFDFLDRLLTRFRRFWVERGEGMEGAKVAVFAAFSRLATRWANIPLRMVPRPPRGPFWWLFLMILRRSAGHSGGVAKQLGAYTYLYI